MTLLYLVRHGETVLNEKGVYYGWTDCGLSDHGLEQSQSLAETLKDVSFDLVVSSPLKRAKDTAILVGGIDPGKIKFDHRLKELNFGDWEGRHYQEIQETSSEEWKLWLADWKNASPPGGESFSDLYRRVCDCIKSLLEDYKGKIILVVAHHGCLRIILSVLLGMSEDGYWHFSFQQGKYTLLEIQDGFCIVKKINC